MTDIICPLAIFVPRGPVWLTVNGGPRITIPGGSNPPHYLPGVITSDTPGAPTYALNAGPNVLGEGANQLTLLPQEAPYSQSDPQKLTLIMPSSMDFQSLTPAVQIYLFPYPDYENWGWLVTLNGWFGRHDQMLPMYGSGS